MKAAARNLLCGSTLAATSLFCTPVEAQVNVTADQVITRACEGFEGQPLSRERLADIMLSELRHAESDPWVQAQGGRLPFMTWIESEPVSIPPNRARAVIALSGLVWDVRRELLRNQPDNAAYVPNPDRFDPEVQTLFTQGAWLSPLCRPATSDNDDGEGPSPFEIRSSPDDLGLSGDALIAAAPAAISITRTVTILDDGSSKSVRDFAINGTLGYRLFNEGGDSGYVYGSYTLNQSRTRPRPTLAPGASEGDGDTNTIEIGGRATVYALPTPAIGIALSGNGSLLHDFTHDSDLLRLRINSSFAVSAVEWEPIPLPCGLGFYRRLVAGLRGICQLQAQFEAAHVLENGTGEFANTDNYGAAGARFAFGLFLPQDSSSVARLKSGAFAEASVRYLPMLYGDLDDIERYDLALGYRFVTSSGLGFDVGFTYQYGTNEKSFQRDDVLKASLGMIF